MFIYSGRVYTLLLFVLEIMVVMGRTVLLVFMVLCRPTIDAFIKARNTVAMVWMLQWTSELMVLRPLA